jgi:hypothetical protein
MSRRILPTLAAAILLISTASAGGRDAWTGQFRCHLDYTLKETAGIRREAEPVEVTLSARAGRVEDWDKEVRVYRLGGRGAVQPVPFQVHGRLRSQRPVSRGRGTESANVVFLAKCEANGQVTYRILWEARAKPVRAPVAPAGHPLELEDSGAGARIANRHYNLRLAGESGSILHISRSGKHPRPQMRFYQKGVPIHFGADVWSPPQSWDHDYDWESPPNEKWVAGPLMAKYHRWGPLRTYDDVKVHLTYTFYAEVPYIHVSTLLEFTEDRSVRGVRIGEIVGTHRAKARHRRGNRPIEPVFTHYAWPTAEGVRTLEIDAQLDDDNVARVEGYQPGTLGILDRDVPWVAAYHKEGEYGIASLRKSEIVMNRFGGPEPRATACTYLAQYGWGFSYWSRVAVFPFGARGTALDRNTVVAKGTVFTTEEALLVFDPAGDLDEVRRAYRKRESPLRPVFCGTGPW